MDEPTQFLRALWLEAAYQIYFLEEREALDDIKREKSYSEAQVQRLYGSSTYGSPLPRDQWLWANLRAGLVGLRTTTMRRVLGTFVEGENYPTEPPR